MVCEMIQKALGMRTLRGCADVVMEAAATHSHMPDMGHNCLHLTRARRSQSQFVLSGERLTNPTYRFGVGEPLTRRSILRFSDDCGDSEDADAEVGDDAQGIDAVE